ncbi:MAG TPA: thioredoxin domain-containing protein [Streptosporangiaceae bacterium]|jgi:protein-disulfide isomerase
MTELSVPSQLPAGATPEGDGIAVGDGPVRVDLYIDFLCPFCKRFELNAADTLTALISEHRATVVYHPMNFLDEASTTRYSTRASAASGCASDGGRFVEFTHQLFVSQPPEGGAGLSDMEIAEIAVAVGVDRTAFSSCAGEGRYLEWPTFVTYRAAQAGVGGTPTVLVQGADVEPDTESLAAAVQQAQDKR